MGGEGPGPQHGQGKEGLGGQIAKGGLVVEMGRDRGRGPGEGQSVVGLLDGGIWTSSVHGPQ